MSAEIEALITQKLDELLPQKLEALLQEREESKTPSMTIICTKGILASTAAALGWDVTLFFTFYGLQLVKKDISDLQVSPIANPGMPMKMPFGPDWFKSINWNIPNIIQTNIPGFEAMATSLMKQTIANNGVASLAELRELSQEAGVKFVVCQMTVELFGFDHADFVDGMDYVGAASFLPEAQKADVNLFI
jgi:peroxiredoxin family protein